MQSVNRIIGQMEKQESPAPAPTYAGNFPRGTRARIYIYIYIDAERIDRSRMRCLYAQVFFLFLSCGAKWLKFAARGLGIWIVYIQVVGGIVREFKRPLDKSGRYIGGKCL